MFPQRLLSHSGHHQETAHYEETCQTKISFALGGQMNAFSEEEQIWTFEEKCGVEK